MYKSPGMGACLVCSLRLMAEQSQGGWAVGNGVREKSRGQGTRFWRAVVKTWHFSWSRMGRHWRGELRGNMI